MMKFFKLSFVLPCLLFFNFSTAQNCGYVGDFRKTVTDNGDSTLTYTFEIDVETTSGGDKSVLMRIDCNSYLFESNECLKTGTSTITYYYGPYTLHQNVCNISPSIIWTGHTNDKCGGSICIGETITLPVTMIDFTSTLVGKTIVLNWSTASELNNMGFEVLHSTNGSDWTKVGWVDGVGNSSNVNNYTFTHDSISTDINYYKLKQIDFDGQFEYTQTTYSKVGETDQKPQVRVFPNPFKDQVQITGHFNEIKILNSTGAEVSVTLDNGVINTSTLLPRIYFAEINTDSGIQRFKLIK